MKNAAHVPIGELAGLDNDDEDGLILGVEGGGEENNLDAYANTKNPAAADDEVSAPHWLSCSHFYSFIPNYSSYRKWMASPFLHPLTLKSL